MPRSNMNIPKTISVGYKERDDTYTGKLAYVIYTDEKGVLRKERSWQSWRNKKLGSDVFDNEPMSGFVLNRGVGGARRSYGWNARNEYIRVYDPRNFEFEISVSNLLFILQECSSIKGKGIEGEFVYAWSGTELVLVPVNCEEYKESIEFTRRKTLKVSKKDIKEGCTYIMKDGTEVMYLGRHLYNQVWSYSPRASYRPAGKKHIFLNTKSEDEFSYIPETGFKNIAEIISATPVQSFSDEYENFKKSKFSCDLKEVKVRKTSLSTKKGHLWGCNFFIKKDDKYYAVSVSKRHGYRGSKTTYDLQQCTSHFDLKLTDGDFSLPRFVYSKSFKLTEEEFLNKDLYEIDVVTEKGTRLVVP